MKAAQVLEFKQPYVLQDLPIPVPGPGELLIRTRAAGFCHTDVLVKDGVFEWAGSKPPITGSHEAVGVVVAVGSGVSNFQKGDRVGAVNIMHPCKSCPDCNANRPQFCRDLGGLLGITKPGAFAEYVLIDAEFTAVLPKTLSFVQAAPLMCAGATIYGAIKNCKLEKGALLGIIGMGALGHLGLQFSKAMGYKVAAVDTRREPLEMVQAADFPHPPDLVLNPLVDTQPAETLAKISGALGKSTEGYDGLDAVIVAADAISAFHYAISILHPHALMMVVAQPEPMIEIKDRDLIFKDITVKGTILPGVSVLQEMMQMVCEHNIRSIVRTYKLDDVNKMVEHFHRPDMKGKFVVEFQGK